MSFDVSVVLAALPAILSGLKVTLGIWLAAAAMGVVLGFVVAALRHFGPAPLGLALRLVVEVLRGTPFLVQIFLLYFGGPYVGLSLDPVPAGLLGLTVYAAAYFSEIFRAGFAAVPRGHVEAAHCVGLTRAQIVRRILVPEMTMLVLPQCVNMAVILVKETAVLSVIAVPEATGVISAIGSQQYAFLEALFLLAVIYWGLVEACGWAGRMIERRLSKFRFA
ncbi:MULTISPECIES: amino acid ABC transporter permease [Methylobacterium]|jgi:polar amino acid transport system permease protein|uniref:Amino acid ABC transporter n=2 Tax=Methylobacterium TaxID=407 RepID=A0A0C6FK97_9HYPH|nr:MULTISPECIES: amino acid ABC transporter permease [Methylobacterium]MBK3397328.1 amino acid ABC transporter permease [Methylobacterium ajmalii]MBK3412687.1 amino acid ABC transporter permease [Methylobacterium ajmalii]MBK3420610.1 amino acid ABC transporter permease [Methylobacterium ajmalii]MBZ6416314.1 amino acid ABC transporter permease [Methylobacterium sp.]SFF36090.1 polar amino acid transport system permease protein [Methylobacterium sp. yr596]